MKKVYTTVARDAFWQDYWSAVGEDVDRLSTAGEYPLHLVDRYVDREKKVIELGCGLGRVLKHYHYQGVDIEGIEYDTYCVEKLKSEDGGLKVRQASVVALPYGDKTFDIAMAFGILGHLENDMGRALREANRVLKEGGLLAGSLCYDNFGRAVFRLVNFVKRLRARGEKHFYTHLFSKDEMVRTLRQYGFEVVAMQPVLSRETLYNYLPFLRRKGPPAAHKLTRSGERYYTLNWSGELAYAVIRRFFPYQYTSAVSFLARKVEDAS